MQWFHDLTIMSKRSWKMNSRNLDGLITTAVLPVMILLSFVYIFGGAIDASGNYIDYIVPGIIVLGLGQVSAGAAVTISTMKQRGILNRFKTMAITQSSVLWGEQTIYLLKSLFSVFLVIAVGILLGFSPELTLSNGLVLGLFVLLASAALVWISFFIGLSVGTEAAAAFPMFLLFAPYLSSGFVPLETLPKVLRNFAEVSPFTPITETIRGLLMNDVSLNDLRVASAWLIGLLLLFVFLTLGKYNRLTEKS
ncbi:ABC transporter permease [Enterococcus mediterraneensis]|uniref:ABC transporter permease n=1 Tax=Enterococcus mediterraneensis TaxID=2364791 RepID=UPI000F05C94A|nr:ABC transporter permease [Enterococcus mediterraneensis]